MPRFPYFPLGVGYQHTLLLAINANMQINSEIFENLLTTTFGDAHSVVLKS